MKQKRNIPVILVLAVSLMTLFTLSSTETASAQDARVIRIARIKIDPTQVNAYKELLKEEIEAAVNIEAGVLMLYAVHDKKDPTSVTTFEVYADSTAYKSHLQTPHFKKYKPGTLKMVKSLELSDVAPIALADKKK